ncbi:ATP-binding protein [Thermodesulfobacteriota bacterium]
MGIKISVCGKGGSGKSTLVSLLAQAAQDKGFKALVVDSDESNSGLFRMLGLDKAPIPLIALVGGRETIKEKMNQPSVLSETDITLEQIPSGYINEKNGLKLISIGKIHQALEGCACPMGVLSREFLKKLRLRQNEIAIVDMEAGIEHFGRGIDNSLDAVLIVVEPSFESIALAEKIKDLASGINKQFWAVLNKVGSKSLIAEIKAKLKKRGMDTIGVISYDASIFLSGLKGDTLSRGRATRQAAEILDVLLPAKN